MYTFGSFKGAMFSCFFLLLIDERTVRSDLQVIIPEQTACSITRRD